MMLDYIGARYGAELGGVQVAVVRVLALTLALVAAGCASQQSDEVAPTQTAKTGVATELALWRAIEESQDLELIHEYLVRYPNGRFAMPAKVRLLELEPVDTPGALARGLTAYREQRFDEALRFLWPQAEVGEPMAQQKLGLMYLAGWGVDPDLVQAFKWLTLAEAAGLDDAENSRAFAGATMDADQHELALTLIETYRPLRRSQGGGV